MAIANADPDSTYQYSESHAQIRWSVNPPMDGRELLVESVSVTPQTSSGKTQIHIKFYTNSSSTGFDSSTSEDQSTPNWGMEDARLDGSQFTVNHDTKSGPGNLGSWYTASQCTAHLTFQSGGRQEWVSVTYKLNSSGTLANL